MIWMFTINGLVIPNFMPTIAEGSWLNPMTGEHNIFAELCKMEPDFNSIHAQLCRTYPGLPAALLGDWLQETAVAANRPEVKPHTLYRVHYDYNDHVCHISEKDNMMKKIKVYASNLRAY
jgi:hypothetical protein